MNTTVLIAMKDISDYKRSKTYAFKYQNHRNTEHPNNSNCSLYTIHMFCSRWLNKLKKENP